MSTTPRRRRRFAGAAAALAAVVSFGALTAGTASADSTPPADDAAGIFCWTEYDFTRSGNTLAATAIRDCTTYDAPQLLPVKIQVFYSDEGGPSGWVTRASGIGVAKTTCIPGWAMSYRHSAILEVIYC
jgi:hypothetical protein